MNIPFSTILIVSVSFNGKHLFSYEIPPRGSVPQCLSLSGILFREILNVLGPPGLIF